MEIFVCIKQVPSTNKVQVDEKTGVLKRDGIASKMNPYDLFAIETALRLKQEAQRRAMEAYGWSTEDFIREFGKNYLED